MNHTPVYRLPIWFPFYLFAVCAIVLSIAACSITPESLTPTQRTEAEDIKSRNEAAKDAAVQAPTPAAKAEAEKLVTMTEKEMADFEARVMRDRAGPIVSGLSAVHPALGWLPGLLPLAPLLGKRGRKHFWGAIQNVNPWAGPEEGAEKGIAPVAAVQDLLRMWGILHSNDASKAAFETPKVTTHA